MRIPIERPTGLLRLLFHRPDKEERGLREALAAASKALEASPGHATEGAWDEAFRDHASYLANVWMPHHPVGALSKPGNRSAKTGGRAWRDSRRWASSAPHRQKPDGAQPSAQIVMIQR